MIIGSALEVSNTLGAGFLEKVYENALMIELRKRGMKTEHQKQIVVKYKGLVVGDYVADILVNETVIVELKAAKAIDEIHLAQALNYLRASGLHTALVLNFGTPKLGIKRVVL